MITGVVSLTEQWVQEQLQDETSGHDWYHIKRVTALGKNLLNEISADEEIVILACLLHDLADDKVVENEEAGMEQIKIWLRRHQLTEEKITHITHIIGTMSFKGGQGTPMTTIEGQIVQDADRLDALGAIGIARTFAYSGHKGQAMYNPELSVRENMSYEEYRHGKSSAVHHFYEKLFKLPEKMNTKQARQLADERVQFMQMYLDQFYSEWTIGEDR